MKAKKFVEVYGLHTIVVETTMGLDVTTIKPELAGQGIDRNSICYITCDKADETFGYKGEYILTKGILFPCKETIGLEADLKELSATTEAFSGIVETRLNFIDGEIDEIQSLIPEQATAENQLADKDFVNSSIATATATFRGTWHIKNNLGIEVEDGENFVLVANTLNSFSGVTGADKNDYTFVYVPGHDYVSGSTTIRIESRFDKYKVTVSGASGGTKTWEYEYSLNNSSFTASQWAAINSNITSGLVSDYSAHIVDMNMHVTSGEKATWNGKVDKTYVDDELAKKASIAHTHIISDVTNLQTILDDKAKQTDFNALVSAVTDNSLIVSSALGELNLIKQNKLIAGSGITIDNATNIISAIAAEPYDDTVIKAAISANTQAITTEEGSRISGDTALQTSIDGLSISKQDTLTAGQNIDITSNVIKAKGYTYDDTTKSFAEGESLALGNNSHAEGGSSDNVSVEITPQFSTVEPIVIINNKGTTTLNIFKVGDFVSVPGKMHTNKGVYEVKSIVRDKIKDEYIITFDGYLFNGKFRFPVDVTLLNSAAIRDYSHVDGNGNLATNTCQHVCGRYNSPSTSSLFMVGNGVDKDNRSNAFSVYEDGDIMVLNDIGSLEGGVEVELDIKSREGEIYEKNQKLSQRYAPISSVMPVGSIIMWAGTTAPSGWFICDNSEIELSKNGTEVYYYPVSQEIQGISFQDGELSGLVNVITTLYGSRIEGEGTADERFYIKIPNLQQRFPLGAKPDTSWACGNQTFNTTIGKDGGENEHQLTIEEMPSHSHKARRVAFVEAGSYYNVIHDSDNQGTGAAGATSDTTGGDEAHNNIPPYLAINFIIKYK